jgi:hypothetical protein
MLAALLGLIPATIASRKGHSFLLWWFYGWMLFILALPHSILIPPRRTAIGAGPGGGPQPWAGSGGRVAAPPPPVRAADPPASVIDTTAADPRFAPCPSCGESIRTDTPMCPFCRHVLRGGA